MFVLLAIAAAAEFVVLPEQEPLRPRIPTLVYVAASQDGTSASSAPVVRATGASIRGSARPTSPGVWAFVVTPEHDAQSVELVVSGEGSSYRSTLEVGIEPESRFSLPPRVDGVALGKPVHIPITGHDLPPIEHLQVVVGEGQALLQSTAEGLELVLTPDRSPFPRVVPIGLRDRTGAAAPVWGTVHLRSRPRVPVAAEPGATLWLEVGGRKYGPFKADADGFIDARVDQYPTERIAKTILSDDLGNTSTSTLPLSVAEGGHLIAVPGERRTPSKPPRLLYLGALDAAGRPSKAAPECRSPALGRLVLTELEPGVFLLPIDGRFGEDLQLVRIDCSLQGAELPLRLGALPQAPARIALQVWPTELSTDFPVAEVRVALEDATGNRLPVQDVQVGADRGAVQIERREHAAFGEYQGEHAVDAGTDRVFAVYAPSAVRAPVSTLALTWRSLPRSGRAEITVHAWDELSRPVVGAAVQVSAGSDVVEVRTNEQGTANAEVPVPGGTAPLVLHARSEQSSIRELASRRSRRASPLGVVALSASRVITLAPGRVAGINIRVDPPVLNTGRNAVAWIQVELEDQAGQPVLDEPVSIHASEGIVGPLIARADGTWIAEFTPARGDRAREVEISVESRSLRSSASLPMEPRLGMVTVGPVIGWITNFGALSSPSIGFDADFRLRLLGGSVMLRLGASGYGLRGKAQTGFGEDATLSSTIVPGLVALLLRQDRGGFGFWGGAGGMLGLQTMRARFGDQIVNQGVRSISGGGLIGGAGYRLGVGDLVGEARWSWLPGTGGELGFTGNLGGLSMNFGYRLVY